MFKKRKIVALVLTGILAFSLAGCGRGDKTSAEAAPGAKVPIRIAFNQSENHPQYKALEDFGKKLEEETDGAFKVEIYPNALLGDQRATVELVQSGAIQMSVVANALAESYNKDFSVIGLPYVYDSQEHQEAVFTSGMLDDLFASTKENGFEVVGAFTAGARNIYTDKPINTPEDLKGYKVRVMESDTMVQMLNLMGGVGTPMAQSEVYTAIQQGVLEGGENNEVTYADLKHYEVAPYYSYTQHLMIPDLLIVNTKTLEEMSPEYQETFKKLVTEAVADEFDIWGEQVEAAKKVAEENGAQFSYPDIKPFQENCLSLHEKAISNSAEAKELYEEIRSLSQSESK